MKIFVVEDNVKLALSIKKGLMADGAVVEVCQDGEEALDVLLRAQRTSGEGFDAIVLDLMLPHLDGLELCRRWRKADVRLPILMLTARDEVSDRVKGLDAGADDYLAKPFAFDELSARLRALLRRPPLEAPTGVLRLADVELNAVTLTATVSGRDAGLTLKEFRLLELLMRHPGQVFSRVQIVNNLWDFEFDGASNVVDVHVKNLRKKVERLRPAWGKQNEFIETVRGVGYCLKG